MADQTALTRNPTARALTATLFPAGRRLPEADAEALLHRVSEHALLARALRLGLLWLDARHLLRHGRRFHRGAPPHRARFIE
ncbi:MAG: GMC oxidoreductase, partial [Alloalcanivorax venustensis]